MKKHFILVGKAGLILYSWLFVLLFIGLIIAYESTQKISWPAITLIVIFCLLFSGSFWRSYFTKQELVLPYRFSFKKSIQIKKKWQWKKLALYHLKIDSLHEYDVLSWAVKKG